MSSVRVHSFALSLDGYGAGPNQNLANPLGVGGTVLHEWAFATRTFQRIFGQDGGAPVRAFTLDVRSTESMRFAEVPDAILYQCERHRPTSSQRH